MLRAPLAVSAVLLSLAAAGCGLGSSAPARDVHLSVTQDFGSSVAGRAAAGKAAKGETVRGLLRKSVRGAGTMAWYAYVNGVGLKKPGTEHLHDGDRVWWDRHAKTAAPIDQAVVGSFPEPFVHGTGGRRLPVRLECAKAADAPCAEVRSRLAAIGVRPARALLGASSGLDTLRVLVGPWAALRGDLAAEQLERGPGASGVFARPSADGRSIAVLDASGAAKRTLGPGSGLIAATRYADGAPTWIVTGTDAGGTLAAAQALDEGSLGDRFALAVAQGRAVPVPALQG